MIDGLEDFLRELRRAGLTVSPGEWLDALRAVESVGLGHRGRFEAALGCTLAKGKRQRDVFRLAFERFFASPAGGDSERPGGPGRLGLRSGSWAAKDAAQPGVGSRAERPRHGMPQPAPTPLARLRDDALDRAPFRGTRLRRVLLRPAANLRSRPSPHHAAAERADVLRRDLTRSLTFDDEREIALGAQRLVAGIRLRAGRRLRRRSSGRLYLRQLFRSNVVHGGVPFVLPRRRRRPAPSRVVLLVDVSWSAARAAGLFLTMAAEFLRRAGRTRVLLFVDRAADATPTVRRFWRGAPGPRPGRPAGSAAPGAAIVRGAMSFAEVLQAVPGLNLDAPSDYGRALHALAGSAQAPRGRNTVLVVLGDGRCNRFDPLPWAFEDLAGRCGAVVWLVPEGVERWGTGDSALGAYLPHADVAVEARDLQGLADGLACLVRRL